MARHQPAVTYLKDRELAKIVADSVKHFHGQRYELLAWVVMPSHFHWLFRPLNAWAATLPPDHSAREVIMQSIKGFTAHRCNEALGRSGPFWQQVSYDHCVRDEHEFERIWEYIERNPVAARLCCRPEDWPFSSAYRRAIE